MIDDHSLSVCVLLLHEPVIQLSANRLAFIVEVINVPAPLMRDTDDGPDRLGLPLSLVRLVFCIPHLARIVFEDALNVLEALWRGLGPRRADARHLGWREEDSSREYLRVYPSQQAQVRGR